MMIADVDVKALAAEYAAGATLEQLARRHAVSAGLVRARLLALGMELRRPGRRPVKLARFQSRPMNALTGFAGQQRYLDSLAQDAVGRRRDMNSLGARAVQLTRAAGARGSGRRRPVVRTLPRNGGPGRRAARPVMDDAQAAELAEAFVAAHKRAEWERAVASLPDHELLAAGQALTIELAGGWGPEHNGNTRGVRLGADGRPERF